MKKYLMALLIVSAGFLFAKPSKAIYPDDQEAMCEEKCTKCQNNKNDEDSHTCAVQWSPCCAAIGQHKMSDACFCY